MIRFELRSSRISDKLLTSTQFQHIDYGMRLAAVEGRNPLLWMLARMSMIKGKPGSLRSKHSNRRSTPKINAPKTWREALVRIDKITLRKQMDSFRRLARLPKPCQNTIILGFENLIPMPDRQARPRSSAPGSRAATDSGGGRPDEPDPDPDPDPERPYIALGIDHKATTPAGPPVPISLRIFSLYRIEMRYRHEGNRPDHPEP